MGWQKEFESVWGRGGRYDAFSQSTEYDLGDLALLVGAASIEIGI